jgi:pimeloyl-ACP methyl ester carboxylesterase
MNGIALRSPELQQEIEPPSAYERVKQLAQPVLVLWGDLDFPFVVDRCRYLAGTIPGAVGQQIPGTAHLPNLEKPGQVNTLITSFLDGRP